MMRRRIGRTTSQRMVAVCLAAGALGSLSILGCVRSPREILTSLHGAASITPVAVVADRQRPDKPDSAARGDGPLVASESVTSIRAAGFRGSTPASAAPVVAHHQTPSESRLESILKRRRQEQEQMLVSGDPFLGNPSPSPSTPRETACKDVCRPESQLRHSASRENEVENDPLFNAATLKPVAAPPQLSDGIVRAEAQPDPEAVATPSRNRFSKHFEEHLMKVRADLEERELRQAAAVETEAGDSTDWVQSWAQSRSQPVGSDASPIANAGGRLAAAQTRPSVNQPDGRGPDAAPATEWKPSDIQVVPSGRMRHPETAEQVALAASESRQPIPARETIVSDGGVRLLPPTSVRVSVSRADGSDPQGIGRIAPLKSRQPRPALEP